MKLRLFKVTKSDARIRSLFAVLATHIVILFMYIATSPRPETYITSGMEAHWKNRNPVNEHWISLSYIGTNAGVIRSYPGVRWPRLYDPTTRPYYHRAVASRGSLALSYAYNDAAGAGKVVTLSEVLYLGKRSDNSSECTQPTNRPER